MTTATKTRKPRQAHLGAGTSEDMTPASIKAIDAKAEEYVDVRNQRMKMLAEEIELHAELLELMNKHHLTAYNFDGYECRVVNGEPKVKVKKRKEKPDGEDDEESEDD